MALGEVVGGVALVGAAAMIGLALTEDPNDDSLVSEPAATFDPAPAEPATSAGATTVPETSEPATTGEVEMTAEKPATTPAPTEPPDTSEATTTTTPRTSTTRPTTTTSAPNTSAPADGDVASIAVQVLNAGQNEGEGQEVTIALRGAGFDLLAPRDAVEAVGWTTIRYAPGQLAAGRAVNEVVGTDPALVLAATSDDPNWQEFGAELDVLVLLGSG